MWIMDRILTFADMKIVSVLLHDDFFISSMRKKRENIVRSNRKNIELNLMYHVVVNGWYYFQKEDFSCGNLQRVRLIYELNWRECPLAIANYIWSEIVTNVVGCVTSEATLLRLQNLKN
ncbi:hypothetical protein PV326_013008 [Microctonus aethiopoides]|nr:hypothetical protein PV326_013008 [Microctonus aethiopoides]